MIEGFLASSFSQLAIILLLAAFAGALAGRIKQPILIAYIVIGILAGPAVFGFVKAHDQIDLLAQIGIAVLLFIVGLKLDLRHVRHIGPVALATGLGQLAFTIAFGFALVLLMGKTYVEAFYVAVALTFSSTIIIVKLLTDKREIDSLHGRIAVGFLIVQDIAVVVAMMAMSALRGAEEGSVLPALLATIPKIALTAVFIFLMMRFVLPKLADAMAGSQELLTVFAVAWGTSMAAFGEWFGFSKEAGAFLAGFSLASLPYRESMSTRLSGIKDFMLLFFFIDLGSKLDFSLLGEEMLSATVLSLFVLIGNPLIVMAIMGYMGYRKRTGFLAGLTVAQISEFSIIFVTMGISLGHVGREALGLVTLVGLVTIMMSTYMILYSQPLFVKMQPWLGIFERKHPHRELSEEPETGMQEQPDAIIFGLGRFGSRILEQLKNSGVSVLGVDFDPELARNLRKKGYSVKFGDGQDQAFLDTLPIKGARWVIVTMTDLENNFRGLLHEMNFSGKVAGVARDSVQTKSLELQGIDHIFNPFIDGADFAAQTILKDCGKQRRDR